MIEYEKTHYQWPKMTLPYAIIHLQDCRSGFNPIFRAKARPTKAKFLRGFTLLEMLLVLALMGAMLAAMTVFVDSSGEQQKYVNTRIRLQQIKAAITTTQTTGGEPVVSGFVADMGRLPNNLQELIDLGGVNWDVHNISLSGATVSGVLGADVVVGQLWGGWRGPYLDTMPESTGPAFRDGWSNPDVDGDLENYGWKGYSSAVNTAITLQSFGLDGTLSGVGFSADYPAEIDKELVGQNAWTVSLSGVSFQVKIEGPPDASDSGLKLRLFYTKNGTIQPLISADDFSAVSGMLSQQYPASFDSSAKAAPIGKYAAVVVCPSGKVYDGNCDGDSTGPYSTYYFTLTPRAVLPITIPWNIY